MSGGRRRGLGALLRAKAAAVGMELFLRGRATAFVSSIAKPLASPRHVTKPKDRGSVGSRQGDASPLAR